MAKPTDIYNEMRTKMDNNIAHQLTDDVIKRMMYEVAQELFGPKRRSMIDNDPPPLKKIVIESLRKALEDQIQDDLPEILEKIYPKARKRVDCELADYVHRCTRTLLYGEGVDAIFKDKILTRG